jgi:hypothetical protein
LLPSFKDRSFISRTPIDTSRAVLFKEKGGLPAYYYI